MAIFLRLDSDRLAAKILEGKRRVLLCMPGFADSVGSALVSAFRKLGPGSVTVVLDGSDQAARLGYGHFDAIKQISDAGIPVRIEQGLRLGIVVVDGAGWFFASPPLLVDATMEEALAPNAIAMSTDQIEAALAAVNPRPETNSPEIGSHTASAAEIEQTHAALEADPPQKFDVARKVTVFNAFVEFVEIELIGTQLSKQRVALPPALLLAVSDKATRDRLTTNFQLVGSDTQIGKQASGLRRQIDQIRRVHTRSLGAFGSITLRSNRAALETAIKKLEADVTEFQAFARGKLQQELDKSRKQLIESVLPGLKKTPPEALTSAIVGKPTADQLRRWIDEELNRVFPKLDALLSDMQVNVAFKGVTYETLNEPKFQVAAKAAYPLVDFEKPFSEFTAARAND